MAEQDNKSGLAKLKDYLRARRETIKASISVISYVTKPLSEGDQIDPRIVTHSDPRSHIAEQYRSIRTHLASLSPGTPGMAFLITSALRGEGKTITASNLAMVFSQGVDQKTILVDADLRKPYVHRVFGLKRFPGLSEVLTGQHDLKSFTENPTVGNLYIVPGGKTPANPVELLASSRMKEVIKSLREQFDWIIFDVAPIIPVTDPGVLGSLLDGSLLVVRAAKTQAVDVEKAYSLLLEAKANPIGSVMTGVVTYIPYYLYRYRYIYAHHYYGPTDYSTDRTQIIRSEQKPSE